MIRGRDDASDDVRWDGDVNGDVNDNDDNGNDDNADDDGGSVGEDKSAAQRDYAIFRGDFMRVYMMLAFQILLSLCPYLLRRAMEDRFGLR